MRIFAFGTSAKFSKATRPAAKSPICRSYFLFVIPAGAERCAWKISEAITREFQVEAGGTTRDRLFSYHPVNCVGACALAPVLVVDGKYYDGVTPESALEILHGLSPAEQTTDTTSKEAAK